MLVLTGYSKATYRNKPFYYSEAGLGLTIEPGKPFDDKELKAKVDLAANTRFWKYAGSKALGTVETLILMAAGYGVITFLLNLWTTAWSKVGQ